MNDKQAVMDLYRGKEAYLTYVSLIISYCTEWAATKITKLLSHRTT